MKTLSRSKLAKASGVGIETLRFYETKGLIKRPSRSESGYRQYKEEDASQVRFIKRAQELGFTLREVKSLMDLQATSKSMCAEVRKKADSKIAEIEDKIADLKAMLEALKIISKCCAKGQTTPGVCSMHNCFNNKCD